MILPRTIKEVCQGRVIVQTKDGLIQIVGKDYDIAVCVRKDLLNKLKGSVSKVEMD